jgi:serine/threonine-protein kinase HipA
VLEGVGDFKSVLAYSPDTPESDFISLTMPVRTESYVWDDQLTSGSANEFARRLPAPVLHEQFGPQIGANPVALLSVIGRNMVGHIQVAAAGATLNEPAKPIEVAELLQGDNSEQAFAELVRQHATSGVSGVLPKFLDTEVESAGAPGPSLGRHQKTTLLTRRHIVKGSSGRLPYVALNEYLCMQVVAQVIPSAKTEVSRDGNALVVYRFDVDQDGQPLWGMEDFCALLGLRPAAKYETTWERIARAVRDHVPGSRQYETFRQLTAILLLTYALRNADCHAKNLALLYTSRADAHLSPAYDFLTTSVYAGYQHTRQESHFWAKDLDPGQESREFIAVTFGVPPREQAAILESISQAVSQTVPLVLGAIKGHPEFGDIGKRMLLAWQEGVTGLQDNRVYALGDWPAGKVFAVISDPPKLEKTSVPIGRSPLLAARTDRAARLKKKALSPTPQ